MIQVLLDLLPEDQDYRIELELESEDPFTELGDAFQALAAHQPTQSQQAAEATTVESPNPERTSDAPISESTPAATTNGTATSSEAETEPDDDGLSLSLSDEPSGADTPEDIEEAPETSEEPDDEVDITLSPETWKFRAASMLLHADGPLTAADIVSRVDGTSWEKSRKRYSDTLGALFRQDAAERQRRERDDGYNPYEYWLTEAGEAATIDAEDEAEAQDALTFPLLENEPDATAERVTISPDTQRFHVASAVYNSAKPAVAKDVETRLEDTDWELDRNNISATLGDLASDGLADREKRTSERGNPFEYWLTDTGEQEFERVLADAEDDEDVTTYEEVVAGK